MKLLAYARSLTLLWWIGGALVILLLLMRLIAEDAAVPAITAWLATYLLPGLTLVSGAAAATRDPADGAASNLGTTYWVAVVASGLYLLILMAAVLKAVLTVGDTTENLLRPWGMVLGLLQAIVIGLLGRFFTKSPGAA